MVRTTELEVEGNSPSLRREPTRLLTEALSKKFPSLEAWVAQCKQLAESDEVEDRQAWAKAVEDFVLTRVSPVTGRPLSISARASLFWAASSYPEARLGESALGDYTPIFADTQFLRKEAEYKRDASTITLDEMRKLVLAANTRDRAIL